MLIRSPADITSSEITPESLYLDRRTWIRRLGLGVAAAAFPRALLAAQGDPNSWEEVTGYNNFYEFGTGKDDPARNAGSLRTRPWTVKVEGEVARPGSYDLEALFKGIAQEERIYRFRCVEAWSMVVPWNGYPLGLVIKRLEPTSR
ncbi:MAG: molybdopterin-dependent oxidoreductase, partial [Gemmatimonadota bacterium]